MKRVVVAAMVTMLVMIVFMFAILTIVRPEFVQNKIAIDAVRANNQDVRDIQKTISIRYPYLHKSEAKFYAYWSKEYSRLTCEEWYFPIAIIRYESNFNPGAESDSGAQGLMQLMNATRNKQCKKLGLNPKRNSYNIDVMCGMDELLRDRDSTTTIEQLIRRYNSGSKKGHSTETNDFVRNVMAEVDTLKQIYTGVKDGSRH